MLDIKFIRDNKEVINDGARKKHIKFNADELISVDDKRKTLLASIESKRAEQNSVNDEIIKATPERKSEILEKMKVIKEKLQKEEEELKSVMKEWQTLMLQVPNIPDMTVPEGESDKDNVEVKSWGEKPKFTFKPKDHIEILEGLDIADFERGTKLAGFRGYILKNDAVLLNFAIWQYAIDYFVKQGFELMIAPSLVKKELLFGTGYLPQGEEDLYKTQDNTYLAGTGEVPTMGYYGDEIISKEMLPKKILTFSPCFRREAGSHGKDVKGLYRVHEFFKLEQVVLCEASHEESVRLHEELTKNAEDLLRGLNIAYRVVVNCGGDLGLGQVKKYDIEAWRPGHGSDGGSYGETHSSSYFHDFQTRRLNIKYKDNDGKTRFAHSLNNTAFASPRILISILENYQNEDGTVRVPEVLKKYIGKDLLTKKQ